MNRINPALIEREADDMGASDRAVMLTTPIHPEQRPRRRGRRLFRVAALDMLVEAPGGIGSDEGVAPLEAVGPECPGTPESHAVIRPICTLRRTREIRRQRDLCPQALRARELRINGQRVRSPRQHSTEFARLPQHVLEDQVILEWVSLDSTSIDLWNGRRRGAAACARLVA